MIHKLILDRILSKNFAATPYLMRNELHLDTTPVPYFGNLRDSSVVTLGLNPSGEEFPKKDHRRLIHLSDLGLPESYYKDASDWMNTDQAQEIVSGLDNYFERRPYEWFDPAETFLQVGLGASYFDDTSKTRASHIDVFPWVTNSYATLSKQIQKDFSAENASFLSSLFGILSFDYLIVLGRSTMEVFSRQLSATRQVMKYTKGEHGSSFEAGLMSFGARRSQYFYTSKGPSAQFRGQNQAECRREVHLSFGKFVDKYLTSQ